MKRFIKFILICMVSCMFFHAAPTPQIFSNILIVGSDTLIFRGDLLCYLDSETFERWCNLFGGRVWKRTCNYSGYYGKWELKNGELILNHLKCEMGIYDPETDTMIHDLDIERLREIFPQFYRDGEMHVDWYTGILPAAYKGTFITSNYDRAVFEHEAIYQIDKGKVVGVREYHNTVLPGLPIKEIIYSIGKPIQRVTHNGEIVLDSPSYTFTLEWPQPE